MAIENFTRTKAAIKIYEDLTQEEYDALTKEPHSFYLVNGVGIYKGTTLISAGANSSMDEIVEELNQAIAAKQDTLVSGTNIKTINGESILGEGNIDVAASDDGVDTAYVEDEVLYIDDDTSAASGGVTIIEKTLSGSGAEMTIENFTLEEVDTIINDKSAIVVASAVTEGLGGQILIFTQQEGVVAYESELYATSLVSYSTDNNYYWQLMVGKNQGEPMAQMRIIEISSGGLTEEQVQALIDNAIGTTLQGAF